MAKSRVLSSDQEKKVLELFATGHSGAAVADVLGVSREVVYRFLHKSGVGEIKKNRLRKYVSAEDVQRMIDLYRAGSSCEEISSALRIPWSVVHRRLRANGVELRPAGFRSGAEHHAWNGGRTITPGGYVLLLLHPDDPFFVMGQLKADGLRYVLEHRYVMAKKIGRPLRADETVHHKDGDKQNNTEDNLQLCSGRHGRGQSFRCADCGSYNVESFGIV